MEIKSKTDSSVQLKRLGLNYIDNIIIETNNLENAKLFVEQNPAEEYCLRSLDSALGQYFFAKNIDEIIELSKNYNDKFWLGVSTRPLATHLLLLGDIKVDKERNIVDLVAKTSTNANHRNLDDNPEFNFHTTLEDDNLWNVPSFLTLINYISKHHLYNMVVEFAIYDCPVGHHKENILIYEIRTNY
ncbi:MAG: hypothetical protein IJX26_02505 [Clostridia bacterium]|nr:hypothetical protein [Clostridia bacterium]